MLTTITSSYCCQHLIIARGGMGQQYGFHFRCKNKWRKTYEMFEWDLNNLASKPSRVAARSCTTIVYIDLGNKHVYLITMDVTIKYWKL